MQVGWRCWWRWWLWRGIGARGHPWRQFSGVYPGVEHIQQHVRHMQEIALLSLLLLWLWLSVSVFFGDAHLWAQSCALKACATLGNRSPITRTISGGTHRAGGNPSTRRLRLAQGRCGDGGQEGQGALGSGPQPPPPPKTSHHWHLLFQRHALVENDRRGPCARGLQI